MKKTLPSSLSTLLKASTSSKILRFFAFYFILFALPNLVFAQNKIWQSIDNEPLTLGVRQIIPQKYRVYKLDISAVKTFLSRTPMEFSTAAQSSTSILDLPMPDGSMQQFAVFESPIMEAELANKFPDIKTYTGYSLENKATTVRFDFTQFGFHAMILSPEGTFFIDPFSNGTTEYYISYDKKDFTTKKDFSCGVDTVKLPTIDSTNKKQKPQNIIAPSAINASYGDAKLRTYRLALAATGEYTAFHGGTVAGALAAQVTTMNRVNSVFLKDFAVKMLIVANNNLIIYTNAAADPYTNNDGELMLDENITNVNLIIGTANYDIGHVFSTGGGGVAYTPSVCASFKAGGVTGSGSPVGDAFDIDYVAHEIGHQFGGNHTQNNDCQRNEPTAYETGSGSTIMGYAGICSPNVQNNSDAYFHGGNFPEMHSFITGAGNTCATQPVYTNAKPILSSNTASQTIPKGTPFLLTATATDADGNASLTYGWEQIDNQISTQPPSATATGGPNFRSFNPSTNSTRYFPRLANLVTNVTPNPNWEVLPTVARSLNFRLIVRDNAVGGGTNDHVDITLTVDATSGPLVVNIPSATGIVWNGLSTQNVTWNVANTNVAPVSCTNVDILLSTDGGLTYPTTLASNVANNGSASVTVPNIVTSTARIMVKGTGRAFFDISNNNFSITAPSCVTPNAPTLVAVNSTAICSGTSISLSATCATGTITWYTQNTGGTSVGIGNNFAQSPAVNTTYYAACEIGSCKSNRVATNVVLVNSPAVSIVNDISSGTTLMVGLQTITATNKVISPANVTYKAGNSISLNNGFEARSGSIFLARIGGCNN